MPFVPITPAFWLSLPKHYGGKCRNASRASLYQGGPCTCKPTFPCPVSRGPPAGPPGVLLLGWELKPGQIFAFGVVTLRFSPRRSWSGLLSAPRVQAMSAARKPVSLFPVMCCRGCEPRIAMMLYSLSNHGIYVDVEYNSQPTLIILS